MPKRYIHRRQPPLHRTLLSPYTHGLGLKYYEKYIPEDLQKKFNEAKKEVSGEDEFVKKEDFNKILEKLEKIEQRLSKDEAE